ASAVDCGWRLPAVRTIRGARGTRRQRGGAQMTDRSQDREPSLVRTIRGPITLITVGVLFAANNFTQYSFDKTWPVLLIVFGLLSLLRRGMEPAPPPSAPPPMFPPPQYNYA